MVPVTAFLVVLACALWAGRFFDREGSSSKRARRRSPVRRTAFRRKLPLSTGRSSKRRVCPTRRCVRAVYRRGAEKVELFAFPAWANALEPSPSSAFSWSARWMSVQSATILATPASRLNRALHEATAGFSTEPESEFSSLLSDISLDAAYDHCRDAILMRG